jgi:hypothetical protein
MTALVASGAGDHKGLALALLAGDAAWLAIVVWLVRGVEHPGLLRSIAYRLSLVGITLASYLQLRWILPVVTDRAVDSVILAFDLRVFGFEPALAWDRFVSPATTEWFSFFYYGYFIILALYAIPMALFRRDGVTMRQFGFGILFVFCVGHLVYTVVPAHGPYVYVPEFSNELRGSFFWPLVKETVAAAGAGKDIFPSLHTAVPTFFALFAFVHRKRAPFSLSWIVTAVFASQIVIATMFLRWHYLADILGGLALAAFATWAGGRVAVWEGARRASLGLPPVYPPPLSLGALLPSFARRLRLQEHRG